MPGTGQSLIDQWVDSTDGDTFGCKGPLTPALTGEPVTIDDTAPTTDQWNMAAVEVTPASASSPESRLSIRHPTRWCRPPRRWRPWSTMGCRLFGAMPRRRPSRGRAGEQSFVRGALGHDERE